jgi:hypothetical protein
MLRHSATTDRLLDELFASVSTAVIERSKIANWVGEMIAEAQAHPGLIRAWHVASNQDAALVTERQARFDASVKSFAQYIGKLNAAGLTNVKSPAFNAYALVALCTAIVRECAVERVFVPAKSTGLIEVIVDLLGLPADEYAEIAQAVAS